MKRLLFAVALAIGLVFGNTAQAAEGDWLFSDNGPGLDTRGYSLCSGTLTGPCGELEVARLPKSKGQPSKFIVEIAGEDTSGCTVQANMRHNGATQTTDGTVLASGGTSSELYIGAWRYVGATVGGSGCSTFEVFLVLIYEG